MIIYNEQGNTIYDIAVDDSSYRYRAIMGKNDVELNFSLTEHIEVPVGSYINYQGEKYTLWYPENFTKKGTRYFEYSVTFISDKEYLKTCLYKLLSAIPYELKFPLTAKPIVFIQLMCDCLNQNDTDWTVGKCIDMPEIEMAFNYESCYDVLGRLADKCKTEWDITAKVISLCKVEHFKDEPLPLSYGRGNGFKTGVGRVSQVDKQPCTTLFVSGGERNINLSTYGSKTLLLPRSQVLEYQERLYETDEAGMSIKRIDKKIGGHKELGFDGSNYYPSRVGTVSRVETFVKNKGKEDEYTVYDIIDESIPEALDFSQCRIDGEKITIIFQSGILTGKEFEIEQTDNSVTGYVHSERRFKLVQSNKSGMTMPNETFSPAVGDKYAVFHISLPGAYICDDPTRSGASWDMFREAVRYKYENEDDCFVFKGELDGVWSKKVWLQIGGKIVPGAYILFSDNQFQPDGIQIRITGVRDYINKPHSPYIELSNTPVAGYVSNDLGKLESNEVIADNQYKNSLDFTMRRFQDAKATQSMLEKALLNFAAGTNPLWVHTMSVLIGDEQLQFQYVNNRTEAKEVDHNYQYNNDTKIFSTPSGIVQHLTLGIETLSSAHKVSDFKFWNITGLTSPPLTDPDPFFLFLVCEKNGTNGTFLLSKTAFKLDPGNGYYYFLTGALGPEIEGIRSFATTYGFTELGPGWMRIKQIISPDGKTYFNVAMGEIGGKLVLKAGSSGLKELAEWTGVDQEIKGAQQTADDAQQAADDAIDEARIITGVLNDWASDSYISPMEKTGLKQQKSDIMAEYQEISAQVTRYSLTGTSAWLNYYNTYLSAISALDKYTAASPSDIPVQSDYGNIARYYSFRKVILDAIAAAAKKVVDDLAKTIGGMATDLTSLAYLKEAIKNETASIGGLLLTSLLKLGVKNGSTWQEKAGINGTAKNSNDVVAWFGGTLSQAVSDTAAIVFRLDGSGQMAGGAIKWFKENNVWKTLIKGFIDSDNLVSLLCGIRLQKSAPTSSNTYGISGVGMWPGMARLNEAEGGSVAITLGNWNDEEKYYLRININNAIREAQRKISTISQENIFALAYASGINSTVPRYVTITRDYSGNYTFQAADDATGNWSDITIFFFIAPWDYKTGTVIS